MQELKEYLRNIINDVICIEDINKITNLIGKDYGLDEYINGVEFSYEHSQGLSHENTIDFDYFAKQLIINIPLIQTRLHQLYNDADYQYNWMALFYELIYAIEDVKLDKDVNDNKNTPEVKIYNLYKQFLENPVLIDNLFFEKNIKNKINLSENLIDPLERIKTTHAYFYTYNLFTSLKVNKIALENFQITYGQDLLNGYSASNQGMYPLRNLFSQNSKFNEIMYMRNFKWFSSSDIKSLSDAAEEVHKVEERLALGYPIDSIEYNMFRRHKI